MQDSDSELKKIYQLIMYTIQLQIWISKSIHDKVFLKIFYKIV